MKWLEYFVFKTFVNLQRITPFRLLYVKSDVAFFLMYHVFRYRKKVVFGNLERSFPDKSPKEIRSIARKFFRHLTDVFFETAKGMTANPKKLNKRYKILNPEVANKHKGNIIFLATHYGNWEWGIQCFNSQIRHQGVSLYLPLNNKYTEKYGVKKRQRTGMSMVAVQKAKECFSQTPETPLGFILAADQTPSNMERCYWMKFLNQDTPCIHGPEAYSRKYHYPVVFLDVRKVKRGYYEIRFEDLPLDYEKDQAGALICRYMSKLESVVNETPEYWLWSHRRWKREIPNNIDELRISCK